MSAVRLADLAERRLALAPAVAVGKTCTSCKRALDFACFPKRAAMRDGFSSWCRECHAAATRNWLERDA